MYQRERYENHDAEKIDDYVKESYICLRAPRWGDAKIGFMVAKEQKNKHHDSCDNLFLAFQGFHEVE